MKTSNTSDTVMGAIGGIATGYVLWLLAISIGDDVTTVSRWSLVVLVASGVLALCAGVWGWSLRRRGKYLWAAFAFGLPLLPVVLTLAVLADIANIYV
jgi:cytochrome bd-type quinol oxidase subunit 1